ncbi:hypothetical protein ABW19_dt0201729 [Dactylella cylindrospora]|nr:hypothetical protein ABW19_dt0201729 [Dactylella cylindrospora]
MHHQNRVAQTFLQQPSHKQPYLYLTGQRPRTPPTHSHSHFLYPPQASTGTSTPVMPPCIVVSITGGQAAGKKKVQAAVAQRLRDLSNGRLRITCLHMGDFMKNLADEDERQDAKSGVKDMDCIDAYDLDWLVTTMEKIRDGDQNVKIPQWDILEFQHAEEIVLAPTNELGEVGTTDVLIVEGCYMLCERRLVEMADIKLFEELSLQSQEQM